MTREIRPQDMTLLRAIYTEYRDYPCIDLSISPIAGLPVNGCISFILSYHRFSVAGVLAAHERPRRQREAIIPRLDHHALTRTTTSSRANYTMSTSLDNSFRRPTISSRQRENRPTTPGSRIAHRRALANNSPDPRPADESSMMRWQSMR